MNRTNETNGRCSIGLTLDASTAQSGEDIAPSTPGNVGMDSSSARKSKSLPDRIPIHEPHILAMLWEEQELRERLDQLNVIVEHIDSHDADLTIVAWEKFLSLVQDLDQRRAFNLENARKNALRLGIELADGDEGMDALSAVLASIDPTEKTKFPGAEIHPAQHLVCNIGVLRAGTIVKTAYSLMISTHATRPTTGLVALVSHLDRHKQMLVSELQEHRNRMLMKFAEQGYEIRIFDLIPELGDIKGIGAAYWKVIS